MHIFLNLTHLSFNQLNFYYQNLNVHWCQWKIHQLDFHFTFSVIQAIKDLFFCWSLYWSSTDIFLLLLIPPYIPYYHEITYTELTSIKLLFIVPNYFLTLFAYAFIQSHLTPIFSFSLILVLSTLFYQNFSFHFIHNFIYLPKLSLFKNIHLSRSLLL